MDGSGNLNKYLDLTQDFITPFVLIRQFDDLEEFAVGFEFLPTPVWTCEICLRKKLPGNDSFGFYKGRGTTLLSAVKDCVTYISNA